MEMIKWNIGIMIIRFGYWMRKYVKFIPLGRFILKCGYKLRGKIPQKTWHWNHV